MKVQDMKENEKYGIFSFFTGAGFLDLGIKQVESAQRIWYICDGTL